MTPVCVKCMWLARPYYRRLRCKAGATYKPCPITGKTDMAAVSCRDRNKNGDCELFTPTLRARLWAWIWRQR